MKKRRRGSGGGKTEQSFGTAELVCHSPLHKEQLNILELLPQDKHMPEGGNMSEVCKRTADCRIVHCLFSMRIRAPPKKPSNGMFKI